MKRGAIFCLLVAFVFWGSTFNSFSDAKEQESVKIGVLLPLSGPLALEGMDCLRGYEVVRKIINDKGGLWGRPIEYVKGDAVTVQSAMSECERLITVEGVKVIMGTYSSPRSAAATAIAERYGVVYFETCAVADEITERGLSHVFRICIKASGIGRQVVADICDLVLPKMNLSPEKARLAIAHENSTWGTSIMKGAEEEIASRKLRVVIKAEYDSKTTDLSSLIVKLKNAKPDVLFTSSYAQDSILLTRQSKELNFYVKVLGATGGVNMPDFVKGVGKGGAEGIMHSGYPSFSVNPIYGADKIERVYRQMYQGREPSAYALNDYAGAKIALDIIERAGSLDDKAIIKAALTTDLPRGTGANGVGVKFNPPGMPYAGQNIRASCATSQYQDGELRVIGPPDIAQKGVSVRVPIPTWEEKEKIFK